MAAFPLSSLGHFPKSRGQCWGQVSLGLLPNWPHGALWWPVVILCPQQSGREEEVDPRKGPLSSVAYLVSSIFWSSRHHMTPHISQRSTTRFSWAVPCVAQIYVQSLRAISIQHRGPITVNLESCCTRSSFSLDFLMCNRVSRRF